MSKGVLYGALIYCLSIISFPSPVRSQHADRKFEINTGIPDTLYLRKLIIETRDIAQIHTDSAVGLYFWAIDQSRLIGYKNGYIGALNELGVLYMNNNDYRQAIKYFSKAAVDCDSLHFRHNYVTIYNNLGLAYTQLFEFERAFHSFHTALNNTSDTSELYGYLLINTANCLNLAGNQEKAGYYMNKAIEVAGHFHKAKGRYGLYINLANLYIKISRPDSAALFIDSAVIIAGRSLGYGEQAMALKVASAITFEKGDKITAEQQILQAYELVSRHHVEPKIHNGVIIQLGLFYFNNREYKKAEEKFLDVLSDLHLTTYDRQFLFRQLVDLYEAVGDYKQSSHYLRSYYQFHDSLQTQDQRMKLEILETKYRTTEKDKELFAERLKNAEQQRDLTKKNIMITSVVAMMMISLLAFAGIWRYKQKIMLRDRQILQLRSVMEGEEQERGRLSRELHDGIGSMLTGVMMNLKALQQQSPAALQNGELNAFMAKLGDIGKELHKTSQNLSPEILATHDLGEAIQLHCDQINALSDRLRIGVQVLGNMKLINPSLALSLYRVLQELVQNIQKHSAADNAEIQLRLSGTEFCILVEDNGVGFELSDFDTYRHFGLSNIKHRIEAVNGVLSVTSASGQGTIVCIEIDLNKKKWKQLI